MSRVGRSPIPVPSGVNVTVGKGNLVKVEGPKGKLEQQLNPEMEISQENGELVVKRPGDSREDRAQHGLTRALLNNMVVGVSQQFTKRLEIRGVGYRAEMNGDTLVLQVGKSHPVRFDPPKDVTFKVEGRDGRLIVITGTSKEMVGQIAAVIRKSRPPEPYKGKGIRYEGEYVRSKVGKKAGK
ncbi:MAG: 50S ribosomal protein L6 [Caldilineaceae bacterium]|nr:50S ribosomal protein L6 [Caldilineaceae bacterium]